jgi:hypothetical protein
MILIAVAITVPDRTAGTAALVSVLAATAVLLAGIGFVGVSVMRSISAVDFEVDRTLELGSAVSPWTETAKNGTAGGGRDRDQRQRRAGRD